MLRPIQVFEELITLRILRGHALADIYLSEAIKMFGASMVAIFETIYLFIFFRDQGITHPAAAVFLFFGIFYGAFALLSPLGARLSSRFGFSRVALASSPFLFLFFLFLLLLPTYPWLLIPTLLVIIVRAALFWPGFHLLFVTSSTTERRGSAFGGLAITSALASIAGPALGGQIITHYGYPVLFAVVLPLILVSALPYFLVKDSGHKFSDGYGSIFKRLLRPQGWKAGLAFAANGSEDESNGRVWPLFLFILAISYSSLGFIVSVGTAVSIATTYIMSRLVDKGDRLKLLSLGSAATCSAWLVRAGVRAVLPAFVSNILYGAFRTIYYVPSMAIFYDRVSAAKNPYDAIVFREVMINMGRAVFLGALAFIALWTEDFRMLFIATAALPVLFPLLKHWKL